MRDYWMLSIIPAVSPLKGALMAYGDAGIGIKYTADVQ